MGVGGGWGWEGGAPGVVSHQEGICSLKLFDWGLILSAEDCPQYTGGRLWVLVIRIPCDIAELLSFMSLTRIPLDLEQQALAGEKGLPPPPLNGQ